jgi:hypothetical protein
LKTTNESQPIFSDPKQSKNCDLTSFSFHHHQKYIGLRGDNMAKSHYSFKKRKKELARKQKQEEKRQRKLDKGKIQPEENPDESQDEIENLQA